MADSPNGSSNTNGTKPVRFKIELVKATNVAGQHGSSVSEVDLPTIQVSFGTSAPQTVLLDTGSGTTWASGPPTLSSTLRLTPQPLSIVYIGSTITGQIAHDTLHISDLTLPHTFGLSRSPLGVNFAGLIGLARPTANEPAPTLMQSLLSSGTLHANQQIVALQLPRPGSAGEVTFGAAPFGDVTWTPATQAPYWGLTVQDVRVNGLSLHLGSRDAIIDSGAANIAVHVADAPRIAAALGGNGEHNGGGVYSIPCAATAVLQMEIGGKLYALGPADYVGSPVGGGGCECRLVGMQTVLGGWVLGTGFLGGVRLALDYGGGGRIGLAQAGVGGGGGGGGGGIGRQYVSGAAAGAGIVGPNGGLVVAAVAAWVLVFGVRGLR